VVVPPEFPIIPILANKFRKIKRWDREKVLFFIDHIYENHKFGHRTIDQLRIDRKTLTQNLLNQLPGATLADLFTTFNASYGSPFIKGHLDLVGDKNPLYSIFIKQLMKIFPDAKFVCLVRDYRDTFCSLRSLTAAPIESPNVALQASRWRFVVKRFYGYAKEYPDRFYLLRYEDLASQPEHSFRKITNFLGIPYDESVFTFYLQRDKIIDTYSEENIRKFHRNLIYPINTGRVNIWKDKMSSEEVAMADQIAGKYADNLGYERKYKDFNFKIYLESRPMAIYSYLFFKFLEYEILMPYGFRKFIALKMKNLVRLYMKANPELDVTPIRSGNKTFPEHSLQSS
jgi:hypothetical protein